MITRYELYRRLWAAPLRAICEEFEITYGDIARLAQRYAIPRPPRGYWKMLAAGTAALQPPLPERPGGPEKPILIPSRRKERREQQARRDAQAARLGTLVVPTVLRRPHPLVARWIQECRRGQRSSTQAPFLPPSYYAYRDADRRRHCILHALFGTLERHGARLSGMRDEEVIHADFGDGAIAFRLRETLRQFWHPLSDDERSLFSHVGQTHRRMLEPTGDLEFRLKDGSRRSWRDGADGRLEDLLPTIAAALLVARSNAAAVRLGEAERLARQEERERDRRAATERKRIDNARWQSLVNMSHRSEEAARVRTFLDRIEAQVPSPEMRCGERTVAEWLAWARARLDAIDPLAAGAQDMLLSLSISS